LGFRRGYPGTGACGATGRRRVGEGTLADASAPRGSASSDSVKSLRARLAGAVHGPISAQADARARAGGREKSASTHAARGGALNDPCEGWATRGLHENRRLSGPLAAREIGSASLRPISALADARARAGGRQKSSNTHAARGGALNDP